MNTTTYSIDRFELDRGTLLRGLLVLNTELLLILGYVFLGDSQITGVEPLVIPFVWINVSLWVFARAEIPQTSDRQRVIGLVVAVAYFGVLTYFGGLWGAGVPEFPTQFRVAWFSLPPGWAPAVLLNSDLLRVSVIPYQLVGYLALAYLVYATVLDAAGSAITGVLGLLSCVSCSWPILASVFSTVLGGSAALAGELYDQSYLLSTVVFLVTIALLYYRPGWQRGSSSH
ncbi:hypothetical protein IL252_02115 [Halomicrobium sp. IBSBa]|uniref:DUF7546 family protein n=1 Tax=Halomicrobium sp. IBSBa TaxID=2778916 RepID=UPI001ABFD2DE|nr:hypothetical protein [Halomicrobium sp. IBSBa]MBO4246609.1 hypothetical protein [Halomicrobium sp. IBSBa]